MLDWGIVSIALILVPEEIEVKYILNCLYAELQVQSSPDIQDVLANSILEFIWKIGNCLDLYTTETYRKKLQLFGGLQSQQSSFDDFVQAFLDCVVYECAVCPVWGANVQFLTLIGYIWSWVWRWVDNRHMVTTSTITGGLSLLESL